MRVFNKQCGLNVQVVPPVQVKHVTAVLQDDVQGIGGLLLVGVRDHTERQPGGWWYEYPYLFDIYTHTRTHYTRGSWYSKDTCERFGQEQSR